MSLSSATSFIKPSFTGGDNAEIVPTRVEYSVPESPGLIETPESDAYIKDCPVPDFISYTNSNLDMIKVRQRANAYLILPCSKAVLFIYLYWLTLAVVFIAGVSRVTLLAFGYVFFCFLFLWVGNELFLKPLRVVLRL